MDQHSLLKPCVQGLFSWFWQYTHTVRALSSFAAGRGDLRTVFSQGCLMTVSQNTESFTFSNTMYTSLMRLDLLQQGTCERKQHWWGAWVAQSVKCLTLQLSSGLDLRVMGLSPTSGSVLTAQSLEPASNSVSPSLPLSHSRPVSVSQK